MASEAEAATPPTSDENQSTPELQEPPRHLYALPQDENEPTQAAPPSETEEDDEADAEEPASTLADRIDWPSVRSWAYQAFTPDSGLYTDRPLSVAEIVQRARHGDQVAANGPVRRISIAHGYVAAANKIALRSWEYVLDHQARTYVVAVLLAVALIIPATRHLVGYLLYPVVWAQQLLLD